MNVYTLRVSLHLATSKKLLFLKGIDAEGNLLLALCNVTQLKQISTVESR